MLIEHDDKNHRISVVAVRVSDAWDAEVRIRRLFSEEKAHVEVVTCNKPTAGLAEQRAFVWACLLGRPGDPSHGRPYGLAWLIWRAFSART